MFVGHYSVAFALKNERNQIPLWVLFVAVQFLDYIWAALVLLGIEKMRLIAGFMAGSQLDAYYMPYSHSLIAVLIWSAIAAAIYKRGWQSSTSAALLVAVAVVSHWGLDLIAHPPDLPIYGNNWKLGLGLWNYRGLAFGIEIGLLALGVILYLCRNRMSILRQLALIGFGVGLIIIQWGDMFVPRTPLSDRMTALLVWVFYSLFVTIAFLVEARRASVNSKGRDAKQSGP